MSDAEFHDINILAWFRGIQMNSCRIHVNSSRLIAKKFEYRVEKPLVLSLTEFIFLIKRICRSRVIQAKDQKIQIQMMVVVELMQIWFILMKVKWGSFYKFVSKHFHASFSEHEDDDEYSSNGQASPGHADDPECEASKGLSKKIENLEENNADNLSRHEAMVSK